jgi:hypothetical protein
MYNEFDKDIFVFCDAAGDLLGAGTPIVVFSALVLTRQQNDKLKQKLSELKNIVFDWGVNVNQPNFEFKIKEIIGKDKYWHGLSQGKIDNLVTKLKDSFPTNPLFAIVLVHKGIGGLKSTEKLKDDFSDKIAEVKKILSDSDINYLKDQLKLTKNKLGLGTSGTITNLLFGLASGLIQWEKITGNCITIADNYYVRNTENISLVFQLNNSKWHEISQKNYFDNWPDDFKPEWSLGTELIERDSCDYFGLQMVDYIAYSTMKLRANPFWGYPGFLNISHLVDYPGYPGIQLYFSSKTSKHHITHNIVTPEKIVPKWKRPPFRY